MLLVETTNQIVEVLHKMRAYHFQYSRPGVGGLALIEYILVGLLATRARSDDFLIIGDLLLDIIKDLDLEDFPSFLLQKHQDYGVEPLLVSRIPGMLDRMLHKIARIKNLSKRPDTKKAIEAELLDILGYSVLGYQFIKKGL